MLRTLFYQSSRCVLHQTLIYRRMLNSGSVGSLRFSQARLLSR